MLKPTIQNLSLLLLTLSFGCGSPGEPGARLQDPSLCVPLEERTDCYVGGEDVRVITITTQEQIDSICQSTCRKVDRVSIGDVEDLSILQFLDIEHMNSISIGRSRLTSLEGLERVRELYDVHIDGNPNLTSLEGLHNLEVANGGIELSENDELRSLKGLRSLRVANNTTGISLFHNDKLENLEGLESLEEVFSLSLQNQPRIRNLDPLRNVKKLEWLMITNTEDLSSIDALAPENETHQVRIDGNPNLPECQIDAYLSRVGIDKETKRSTHLVLRNNGSSDPAACP